jgi:DNA-directed RNA polymerase subunit RPC12/RpoP
MNPQVSSSTFDTFFAWAPLVIGLIIYFGFYVAKRHENSEPAGSGSTTYSCASCGRRGALEQMVPQQHAGATGYYCPNCATAQATAH